MFEPDFWDMEPVPSLDETDKKIIRLLQKDIPLESRPFAALAREVGLTEEEVIERIKKLKRQKVIRRFGVTLKHYDLGIVGNVMVAWEVPLELVDHAGRVFSYDPRVTHCYTRVTARDWPYNMYTMVHARNNTEALKAAMELGNRSMATDFTLLFTKKELKKERPHYEV